VYLRVEILPLHSDERAEKWGKLPLMDEARMGFYGVTWGRASDVVKRYRQKPTLAAHSSCEAWIF